MDATFVLVYVKSLVYMYIVHTSWPQCEIERRMQRENKNEHPKTYKIILYECFISFMFLCAYFFFFLASSSKSCCFFLPPPLLLLPPTKHNTKLFQTLSNTAYGMKRLFLSNSNIFQSQSLQTYDFTKIKDTELLTRFGSQIRIKIKF